MPGSVLRTLYALTHLVNSKGSLPEHRATKLKLHVPASSAAKCGNVTKLWPMDEYRIDVCHFWSKLIKLVGTTLPICPLYSMECGHDKERHTVILGPIIDAAY